MKESSKKILIVDDEPNILLSLDFLFKKKGYEVFIARNGSEAKELLIQHKPNITLLDVMMPEVDGYEVCSFIRSQESLSNMGIIFLSAKSKKTDIEKGIELGADDYMTKPFSTRELTEKVKEVLLKRAYLFDS
jgi:DNA-binding response OmpR family regulator